MELQAKEMQVQILSYIEVHIYATWQPTLAMKLWTSSHSSTQIKALCLDDAQSITVSEELSWEEMANEQENQKALLTQIVQELIQRP